MMVFMKDGPMNKKEIQEQRMKGYFIQATKEILKGEGLRAVSVRNIADQAGYSYATLYNYFKDVKVLIFECVVDFQEECETFVQSQVKGTPRGVKRIKAIVRTYIKYFIQYPGIFDLFFLEGMSDISSKPSTSKMIYTFLNRMCEAEWKIILENGTMKSDDVDQLKEQIQLTVTGLLLFYLNRRYPANYEEFQKMTERQLTQILGK